MTFETLRRTAREHAGELFIAMGAVDTQKHQRCPFADHPDSNASFRIHGDRWICTCGNGDIIDAISRYAGLEYRGAVHWAAERLAIDSRPVPVRPAAIPAARPANNAYALKLWGCASRDDSTVAGHRYAVRKGILHALGAGRGFATGSVVGQNADCLLVPIRPNGIGEPIAIQAINSEGKKQTYGTIGDAYLLLGDERSKGVPWIVVEGWATGHSVRQTVRESVVVVSFGAGRMAKVAALVAEFHKPKKLGISEEPTT
jgi:putative DNA primase/helicase